MSISFITIVVHILFNFGELLGGVTLKIIDTVWVITHYGATIWKIVLWINGTINVWSLALVNIKGKQNNYPLLTHFKSGIYK